MVGVGVSHAGESYHRNNPSALTEKLYLSAARAISPRVLRDLGITCVINATLELPTMAYQLTDCLQIAVEDRVGSKLYVYFDLVADKINSVHNSDGKLMIYCRAGMSRSASLCIAYFMKYHDMSMDEAFQYVRARRPIIHPNVGFLRQLRDYEKRLKGVPAGCVPPAGGFEMPSLTFATECCASAALDRAAQECGTGFVDYENIKVIKPRPKPRQPTIRYSELLETCAEASPPVAVYLCGILPDDDDGSAYIAGLNPELAGESLTVAQIRGPTPLLEATMDHFDIPTPPPRSPTARSPTSASSHSQQQLKRKPFKKISEPAKIAVSFLCLPLERANSSGSESALRFLTLRNRSTHPSLSFSFTVDTDQLQQLPQVAQEVDLECLGDISQTLRGQRRSSGAAERECVSFCSAQSLFSVPNFALVTVSAHSILESVEVFKKQHLLPAVASTADESDTEVDRPRRPRLERTKSIRLPGLKISPLPVELRKTPQIVDEGFFSVADCFANPMPLEPLTEGTATCRWDIRHAGMQISCDLSCAAVNTYTLCEFGTKQAFLKINLASLLTVPLRTTAATDGAVQVAEEPFLYESEMVSVRQDAVLSREYPYYSLVKRDANSQSDTELSRVKEEPQIEVCWFFALAPRKSTKTVCMVPQTDVTRPCPRRRRRLDIQWAAERYYIDLTADQEFTRPLPAIETSQARRIFTAEKLRMAPSVLDEDAFPVHKPRPLPRLVACLYSAWSLTSANLYPLHAVAETVIVRILEMNNLYCEPKKMGQSGQRKVQESCLIVAEMSKADVRNPDEAELVTIPDAFGDMNALKARIMQQNDPALIAIWLEVFKRSVIFSRPIYPFVVVTEPLSIASKAELGTSEETADEWKEIAEFSYTYGKARRTAAQDMEQELHYETVETYSEEATDDCFCDCFDTAEAIIECVSSTMLVCAIVANIILEDLYYSSSVGSVRLKASEGFVSSLHFAYALRVQHPVTGSVATCAYQDAMGSSVKRQQDVPTEFLRRKPFTKLTAPRLAPPSQTDRQVSLWDAAQLPKYEFVQDIEDQADLGFHNDVPDQTVGSVIGPLDTLWFFELEKPEPAEEVATAAATTTLPERPVTPFQLFLPDSYLIDKVGQEGMDVFKPDEEDTPEGGDNPIEATTETGGAPVPKPIELLPTEMQRPRDLIAGSVKPRPSRINRMDKRVSFRDSNDSLASGAGSNSNTLTRRGSKTSGRLVSYQRPSRSRSFTRKRSNTSALADIGSTPTAPPAASEDAKAIAHLSASLKQANEILDRRRANSSTRSPREVRREEKRSRAAAAAAAAATVAADERRATDYGNRAMIDRAYYYEPPQASSTSFSASRGMKGLIETAQNWMRRGSVKGSDRGSTRYS